MSVSGKIVLGLGCVFLWLLLPITAQTEGNSGSSSSSIANLIDYNLALYILIGIAAVYAVITGICCILVCCSCRHRRKKVPPPKPRDTNKNDSGLTFTNRLAVDNVEEMSEKNGKVPPSKSNNEAKDQEHSDNQSSGAKESENVLGVTFDKTVPINSWKNGNANKQPSGSPRLQYTPQGSLVPPEQVKVPFSESEHEDTVKNLELEKVAKSAVATGSPIRSRPKPLHPVTGTPKGSPFPSRKHPEQEIPSTPSDLTLIRRKKSSSGDVVYSAETASKPAVNTRTSQLASSEVKGSPLQSRQKQNESIVDTFSATPPSKDRASQLVSSYEQRGEGSPIRSRPKPQHPVRGSPSQSPFVQNTRPKSHPTISSSSSAGNGQTSEPSKLSISTCATNRITPELMSEELQSVSKKWFIIGKELKISSSRLTRIMEKHGRDDHSKCLAQLCGDWVRGKEQVSWVAVVEALRSELVDEDKLADSIEERHCLMESPNSRTWV